MNRHLIKKREEDMKQIKKKTPRLPE